MILEVNQFCWNNSLKNVFYQWNSRLGFRTQIPLCLFMTIVTLSSNGILIFCSSSEATDKGDTLPLKIEKKYFTSSSISNFSNLCYFTDLSTVTERDNFAVFKSSCNSTIFMKMARFSSIWTTKSPAKTPEHSAGLDCNTLKFQRK